MGMFIVGRVKEFRGAFPAHHAGGGKDVRRRARGRKAKGNLSLDRIYQEYAADAGSGRDRLLESFHGDHRGSRRNPGIQEQV